MRHSDPVHEFKNQLGIILGFAELLLAECDPADRRRSDFEEIHRAAVRALALIPTLTVPPQAPDF